MSRPDPTGGTRRDPLDPVAMTANAMSFPHVTGMEAPYSL